MHIIECYVENFGKLHQYTYHAEKGLNVICEGNGSGKTTLAAFIRAMFYGMPATRTRKALEEAERKKYKPWQGGQWGGYLCFTVDEKFYRIERTFADRDSQDEFRLLDMHTGLISEDYSKNIGEELFGIDRAGFSSSIYIASHDLKVSLNDSLSARIGDKPMGAEDLNHYEKALDLLREQYKKYGKNGKPHVQQRREELMTSYEQKKEQYESLTMVTEPAVMGNYPQWKLTAQELKRLEELDDFFSGGVPSKEQLLQYTNMMNQCRKLERTLAERTLEERNGRSRKEGKRNGRQSDEGQKGTSPNGEYQRKSAHTLMLSTGVLTAILIALTILLFQSGNLRGSLISGIFALAICFVFLVSLQRNRKAKERYSYNLRKTTTAPQKERDVEKRIEQLCRQVEGFLDTFALPKRGAYRQDFDDMELFREQLNLLNQYRMEYEHLSEKDRDYRAAMEALRQKEQQFAGDVYKLERQKLGEQLHNMEVKLAQLEEEYHLALEKMTIIDHTKELLEQAHDEMMAGYLGGVKQHFQKYMNLFDSQLADRLHLDIAMQVGIDEGGVIREMEYYSQGYQDVIRFCQRLALIESLFQKEKPFIILDDPFINLDDEMLGRAKHAMERLSEEMQIIYFTCSWTRELEDYSCH